MIPSRNQVEMLRWRYPEGTRICLESMGDDPSPIPDGTKGTVLVVDDMGTVHCKFENGRSLGLIPGEDSFHVIQTEETEESQDLSKAFEINMSM